MADGAHGHNGPSVRECVETKKGQDSGSVITQHRQTEDKTVRATEFKKHHVTTKNVQVSNCNVVKGKKLPQSCYQTQSSKLLYNHLIP